MKKAIFKITEINYPLSSKENIFHRIFRYIIRLGVVTNLVYSKYFFCTLNFIGNFYDKNIFNLIKINEYFFSYIHHIKQNHLKDAISVKNEWAKFIICNGKKYESEASVKLATKYQELIRFSNVNIFKRIEPFSFNNLPKYYVYGPNSKNEPKSSLSSSTLVLTKFPTFDVSIFQKKIIFLNNYVLTNNEERYLRNLIKDYDKVFIPFGINFRAKNVYKMPAFPVSSLASPMGLARIIITLKSRTRNVSFYFEGFDFGLSKEGYSGKIETGFNLLDPKKFEKQYCLSLSIHDFIFNFLYVKSILKDTNFYGSQSFLKAIKMDTQGYLRKIAKIRDFSCI